MKIVFAIGNPGVKYRNTYHNLGLLFTDFLLKNYSILNKKAYKNADFYKLNDYNVVQSNVFMNCSFDALREIFIFYKLKPEDILVVHDELGIAKFSFKIKYTEGLNGHNGLRDIAKNIGTKFTKLQIGIDHPKNFNPYLSVHDYVLSSLNIDEWTEPFQNGVNELNKFYI